MKPEFGKFGNATWYFCPCCHERIVFEISGNLISGEKCSNCPKCGLPLDWKEEVIRKKSWWRKLRQAICWMLGGEKRAERCAFVSTQGESLCTDCMQNLWKPYRTEPYRVKETDGLRMDVVIIDEIHLLNERNEE